MAKITVHLDDDRKGLSDHVLYLNGKKIGRLKYGESQSFDVKEGNHILQIHFGLNSLVRSRKCRFSILENDEKKFLAYNTVAIYRYRNPVHLVIFLTVLFTTNSLMGDFSKVERWIFGVSLFILISVIYLTVIRRMFFFIEEVEGDAAHLI